ncbi:MAG: extracellular solute-binding protein [Halolamina sp.]
MSKQRSDERATTSRRGLLAAAGVGVSAVAGCVGAIGGDGGDSTGGGDRSDGDAPDSMTVFHAGSLAPAFGAAEPTFEDEYGVDVTREAKGSVASTQKITEQGRSADVLGVSDFRLIRNRVLPEYGEWYAIFATNAMAIQYREDSPGADDVSRDNWWEVLTRDDVTVGHSDPAVDPGGYRAVMTQQLGAEPFDGNRLYDDATYRKLRENSTIPTGTETNLEGQLESGELDYVMYYRSIAATSGKPYVDLQPEVDLSRATDEYAAHYATATVETDSGEFVGAPIAYGVTVPGVAEAPELGAQWVEYFATDPGREILRNEGLEPVDPVVVPETGRDAVPERVLNVASAQSSLGPLEL